MNPKLNKDAIKKTLISLRAFYRLLREHGKACPNEAEFIAYELLVNYETFGSSLCAFDMPSSVLRSYPVQQAIAIGKAYEASNYRRFFNLVARAEFMVACAAHPMFSKVGAHPVLRCFSAARSVV